MTHQQLLQKHTRHKSLGPPTNSEFLMTIAVTLVTPVVSKGVLWLLEWEHRLHLIGRWKHRSRQIHLHEDHKLQRFIYKYNWATKLQTKKTQTRNQNCVERSVCGVIVCSGSCFLFVKVQEKRNIGIKSRRPLTTFLVCCCVGVISGQRSRGDCSLGFAVSSL